MKKRAVSLALALCLMFAFIPATLSVMVVAAPDTYHVGDIAVINAIIANNGLKWTPAPADGLSIPDDWSPDGWSVNGNAMWRPSDTGLRITFLNLYNVGLTGKLDVSGLTELTQLYCGGNQLTAVDVSGNSNLIQLYCDSNQLTAIDVSGNTKLDRLDVGYNQLTSLDVSRNTALERLDCYFNPLTKLDISHNPGLTFLACRDTQLTSLDVSKNTALQILWCAFNELTELDLSKNIALENLGISDNQLTKLDISKNTALTSLECNNNYFPSKAAIIGLDESRTTVYFGPQKTLEAPNLATAEGWAAEHIQQAYEKGFIPDDLQNNYTAVITRQEFCRMAVKWMTYKTGKSIDTILSEKGLSRRQDAFSDTTDPDILAAYALGITSGEVAPTATTPGIFNPSGQFNREQAATMIRNVWKAIGLDISQTANAGFVDIQTASGWAVDAINFCNNNNIMNGTSASPKLFSPKDTYTREQSIVTFNNMP